MLQTRYQGAIEDSYSHLPVHSAAAPERDGDDDLDDLAADCGPSSMFDSFD